MSCHATSSSSSFSYFSSSSSSSSFSLVYDHIILYTQLVVATLWSVVQLWRGRLLMVGYVAVDGGLCRPSCWWCVDDVGYAAVDDVSNWLFWLATRTRCIVRQAPLLHGCLESSSVLYTIIIFPPLLCQIRGDILGWSWCFPLAPASMLPQSMHH